MDRKTTHNSTYPKVAVQWLNQALWFYQSSCLTDSEVLRNRHLRVAANRYLGLEKKINKSVQDFIKCITLHYILSQIK